jgi:hypothetical protein
MLDRFGDAPLTYCQIGAGVYTLDETQARVRVATRRTADPEGPAVRHRTIRSRPVPTGAHLLSGVSRHLSGGVRWHLPGLDE